MGLPDALGVVKPYAGLSLFEHAGRTVRAGVRCQLAPGVVRGLEGSKQEGTHPVRGTNAIEFRTRIS